MTHILIVEDDPRIAALTQYVVKEATWTSTVVASSTTAWQAIIDEQPHLMLLDWMLPDQSGITLLAKIRNDRLHKHLPVIMLTARQMEEDKVTGLDHGADDYLTKPFTPKELTARMKALLRRRAPEHVQESLHYANIRLAPATVSVYVDDAKVELGHTEYKLLYFLMVYPERVFSRSQLLDKVWGNHVIIEERTIDVHVLRLRKGLGSAGHVIRTIRSAGYMLSDQ
jgi:two-component system phosphate regulon response regulator PhoB